MSKPLWKQYDLREQVREHLTSKDGCTYAMEYNSLEGRNKSDEYRKIAKFQGREGRPAREQAISQFAYDLSLRFNNKQRFDVAAIFTSKTTNHSGYDDRLDKTLRQLQEHRPRVRIWSPIALTKSHKPQKNVEGKDRMNVDDIYKLLEWKGFEQDLAPDTIYLIDDVITKGTHFAACLKMIKEHCPTTSVQGVMWAKTVRVVDPNEIFDDVSEMTL